MQFSNDWSDTNYSSARGALLEAWKTMSRRGNSCDRLRDADPYGMVGGSDGNR
jgi:hypothetical protein